MERTMTEAEFSCRAQAIRGESCIVQSSMEVSFRELSKRQEWLRWKQSISKPFERKKKKKKNFLQASKQK